MHNMSKYDTLCIRRVLLIMGRREIINAEIGNRLKKARLSANLTLTEAGEKIGISGSVLRRYEIGTIKSIIIDMLKKF